MPVGGVAHDPRRRPRRRRASSGFPVAVKVADPDIVHKTDRGLVRVGLRLGGGGRRRRPRFARELGRDDVPVLVQPVVAGVEVALGVVRDPGSARW